MLEVMVGGGIAVCCNCCSDGMDILVDKECIYFDNGQIETLISIIVIQPTTAA